MSQTLFQSAVQILRANDRGRYTVPARSLYPFQWNWDSCLSALGLAHIDETRAWVEIETLFEHQWEDGMVPHIVFHTAAESYFPGPEVWRTNRSVPTTGITQPPVAGFAIKKLFERARNSAQAIDSVQRLMPRIDAWHRWFFRCRDPQGTGLVAILHPWESGRDNAADWDDALGRVPTEGLEPFTRRDTQHANPAHRPTQAQYERFIWLVQHFRGLDWDNERLHDLSPFQLVDPGFNAILLRSCADLAELADTLGETEIATRSRAWVERGIAALDTLWDPTLGQYAAFDRATGQSVSLPSVGGILPAVAPLPAARMAALRDRIETLAVDTRYLVPSLAPNSALFDAQRYWRGPVWLVVNYLISDGLAVGAERELASRIRSDSVSLVERSGFAEYFDPLTGEACGGMDFTWTAAMVLEFLASAPG